MAGSGVTVEESAAFLFCSASFLDFFFIGLMDDWCMTKIEADYSTRAGRYLMNFQAGVQWDGNEMFHVEHWLLVHASAAA